MSDRRRAPLGVDPYKPNSARVYNYMLGGKDNYEADQLLAQRMLSVAPDTRELALMSRRFLIRAVRMVAEAGVCQFVDIGAGIPTAPSVHEAAQQVDASARVVYLDYDSVVYLHSTALLSGVAGVTPMLADVRCPEDVIGRLRADALIDFTRPVAILLVGVMHFVLDDEHPDEIIARYREEMAPGSYLVLTHASDKSDRNFIKQTQSAAEGTPVQSVYRSADEIARYSAGFESLAPGLAPIQQWLDDGSPATRVEILGCVLRKS
ncbi:SAM-dependent methyltransferase [Nocardia sp. NPDC052566]|uniref:SAM-dependent methyltransferase n=1 Tax=Nocardia sp. NPDC052566 TaxID=3364330 RepID=UPI0037CBBB48